jgi:hypothetical protein
MSSHCVDWIPLAQNMTQLLAAVNTLMKVEFHILREMPRLAEQLLALQERPCCIALFSCLVLNFHPSLTCVSCPSYSPPFQHHNNIWWCSSLCSFLYGPCIFLRLRWYVSQELTCKHFCTVFFPCGERPRYTSTQDNKCIYCIPPEYFPKHNSSSYLFNKQRTTVVILCVAQQVTVTVMPWACIPNFSDLYFWRDTDYTSDFFVVFFMPSKKILEPRLS